MHKLSFTEVLEPEADSFAGLSVNSYRFRQLCAIDVCLRLKLPLTEVLEAEANSFAGLSVNFVRSMSAFG